jgi:hypothetical protein
MTARLYRTLPQPPPRVESTHHEDCPCDACMTAMRARTAVAQLHKQFVECAICFVRVKVGGRGPLNVRRRRAIDRHIAERHPS